jgi:hypothetical protein
VPQHASTTLDVAFAVPTRCVRLVGVGAGTKARRGQQLQLAVRWAPTGELLRTVPVESVEGGGGACVALEVVPGARYTAQLERAARPGRALASMQLEVQEGTEPSAGAAAIDIAWNTA